MAQNHYLKKAVPHTLKIDNLHWYKDFFSLLGKMRGKMMKKWAGTAKIQEINNSNTRFLL
jgi:hypothetical protein